MSVTGWFMSLSKDQRGGLIEGIFLAVWLFGYELPAVFGLVPWDTTTGTIRDAIKWWHPVALMVAWFLFTLWAHFDRGWSAVYLILTAALIIAAILVHFFTVTAA